MINVKHLITTGCLCLLAACTKEPPPRTVDEFMENPILLEATMVRCAQNRSKTKYEAACVSAREAANRLDTADEQARRNELEAQSKRKRAALRRTQQARTDARRRAAEAERSRKEAEYLGVFDESMEQTDGANVAPSDGVMSNAPTAQTDGETPLPSQDASQAEMQPNNDVTGDLDSIREELKRRQDSDEQ